MVAALVQGDVSLEEQLLVPPVCRAIARLKMRLEHAGKTAALLAGRRL
jgi:hypothetical protein